MASKFAIPEDPDREYFFTAKGLESRRVLRGSEAKKTFSEIPTIDISSIVSQDLSDRVKLAEQIGRAATDVGFMYLTNLPIDSRVMDNAFEALKKFFALPLEEKKKVVSTKSWTIKGWQPIMNEEGDMSNETFRMGNDYTEPEQEDPDYIVEKARTFNQWPDALPEFREALYKYWNALVIFTKKLQGIFALALGLEESALDHLFKRPLMDITIQHYCQGKVKPGLGAHADFGAFTCLLQHEVGGLEVLNANAEWVQVPVKKHTFVVNTGSYFEHLSNGRWMSTIHRVRAEGDVDRYSLPFFYGFDPTAVVEPLLLEPNEEPKYENVNIGIENVKGTFYEMNEEHPFMQMINKKGINLEDMRYDQVLRGVEV
ncbi:hypothetical protein G7Z17_g742 [Cylindrodendrum hubeiense]|uniref:Fe2OG dioxygenase domain-containing protein n=1 Tax=Cylindrodendrum hubeiense TaxID=595255 RepID=A0A9P5HGF7_9HYPO|nr:hypothetical protein G7Z17_g742 [Cylindrodendrum hubeiense]